MLRNTGIKHQYSSLHFRKLIQTNLFKTDTKRAELGVCITEVLVLSVQVW